MNNSYTIFFAVSYLIEAVRRQGLLEGVMAFLFSFAVGYFLVPILKENL